MRKFLFDALIECAKKDKKMMLITSDLGFGAIEKYQELFPEQLINVGVAEQSMIGIATGLAETGFNVYCYSISNFSFIRPWEFIRNGPIGHNLNVKIIGMGAGIDYSHDGLTHYSFDDLSLSLPFQNINVITPSYGKSCFSHVITNHSYKGPLFYRLKRNSEDELNNSVKEKINYPAEKSKIIFFCLGDSYKRAMDVIEQLPLDLALNSKIVLIENTSSLKSNKSILDLHDSQKVVVVENHISYGGLASRISLTLHELNKKNSIYLDGLNPTITEKVGSEEFLQKKLRKNITSLINEIVG